MIKNKKAAMEMSVGTIVTIVLLMTVLVLGLVFIRTIFFSSTDNIKAIDQSIKNEINKLFSEDDARKIVVFPGSRKITIKKGNDEELGFGFSIRNIETTEGAFSYTVAVNDNEINDKCGIVAVEANEWIVAGGSGNINIAPGDKMIDPEFVRFMIPDNAPPCLVRFGIDVKKDGSIYGTTLNVDVKVKAN